ncbi:MAG: ABC transporter permease [Lachnospiraceae bacterium]|nr:ABC transporter permease [Lachnospiraceae bacterium]
MQKSVKTKGNGGPGFLSEHAIVLALLIFWGVLILTNPAFQQFSNFSAIIKEASMYAVCAIGMTFAIISGDMDLSVASQIALSSVVFTAIVNKITPQSPGLGIVLSCLIILALGTLMGLVNGLLIARLKIPAFIATLAMQNVYRGLAQLVNDSPVAIATMGKDYLVFSTGSRDGLRIVTEGGFELISVRGFGFTRILGLPLFFYIMLALAVIGTIILRKTKLGRDILAIGNSRPAARIAGVNNSRTQVKIFALLGFFTAVTALMLTANQGSSNYGVPDGTEFTVISAAVLGGTALVGGKGSIFNTIIAMLFITTISTAMTSFGVSNNLYGIFRGVILVVAFSLNTFSVWFNVFKVKHDARKAEKVRKKEAA